MDKQNSRLEIGASKQISFKVEEKHLAIAVGSGDTRVFSTPMLAAGIEAVAAELARPCLAPDLTSVGIHMDIYHRAASPPGMTITFEATVSSISDNGKRIAFSVRAWDEGGEIGEGLHERVIVNKKKFEEKAAARFASHFHRR